MELYKLIAEIKLIDEDAGKYIEDYILLNSDDDKYSPHEDYSLSELFYWDATPQGDDYWREIEYALKDKLLDEY